MAYHVSTKGSLTVCKAQPGKCPLGGKHFDNETEGMEYLDNLNNKESLIEKFKNAPTPGTRIKLRKEIRLLNQSLGLEEDAGIPTAQPSKEELERQKRIKEREIEEAKKEKELAENLKVFEAKEAIENGASEIDMVINVAKLKDGEFDYVENEIRLIKEAIGNNVLKVIIETCYLTDEEKVKACELALVAKADFVKTSTGFGTGGATYEDVKLMKSVVGDNAKVKASGGVRDKETAQKYVELGAERLGTSSGIDIVK